MFVKSKTLGTSVEKLFRGTMSRNTLDDVWQDKSTALPKIFRESVFLIKKIIRYNIEIEKRPSSYPTIQKEEFSNSPFGKGGQGRFSVHLQDSMKEGVQSISPPSQGGDEGGVKNKLLPFIIDLIFDGAYLRYIEDYCKKIEVEIIKRYLKTYQLVKGLKVIRRAISLRFEMNLLNQYFLEGFEHNHLFRKLVINKAWASEKSLNEILIDTHCDTYQSILTNNLFPKISFRYEVATDNYLLDILRPAKYTPFGPERIFGYLCGLTTEVFNLKLVLGGKMHRIENNLLRERLRKTYV
jgi:hypothetical protein